MLDTAEVFDRVNEIIEDHVRTNMSIMDPVSLGLDARCPRCYVDEKAIAVQLHSDGTLQYYGGFEYIDKKLRQQIGEYVFYLVDEYGDEENDRVTECLKRGGVLK